MKDVERCFRYGKNENPPKWMNSGGVKKFGVGVLIGFLHILKPDTLGIWINSIEMKNSLNTKRFDSH